MNTQDQINFQADLTATDDAGITELLDLFGFIVNDGGMGGVQALEALKASQSSTGQSRGIETFDDVNTAFNMIQAEAVKRGINSVPDQQKGMEYATMMVNGGSSDAGASSSASAKVMHTTIGVVSAAGFGFAGFYIGKKWFPNHKWWVVALMSVAGGALGVWASMRIARSKMVGMAANSESNFSGRTRAVGKRTPDKNDPVGTKYVAKQGFKTGFNGIIPVVGGPRAGQGKGGGPGGSLMSEQGDWIAEGTELTKKSQQVEFGKDMWWIVTDKGWAPLPAIAKV